MTGKLLLACLFVLNLFTFNLIAINPAPKAVRGVIDLSGKGPDESFYVKLNGEWEFYWKKLLRPSSFSDKNLKPDFYGEVPSYWTDYPEESIKTEKFGYATYRLKVILPHGYSKPLGIDMPVFDSSYDLYLNGEYLGGNGTPGKSALETVPGYSRNFFIMNTNADSLVFIINVSNFHHRRGGFWLPVKFGTLVEVQKHLDRSRAGAWSVTSLLLGFSVLFIFFYLIYPKDRSMIYFSMITVGLAIRPLFTTNYLIYSLININWTWTIRFEYLSLFLLIVSLSWFIVSIYPSRLISIIRYLFTCFFTLFAVLTLFLPVKIFSYSMIPYYPSAILLMIYLIYRSFLGLMKKNTLDIIYFSTFILLLAGGIHDIRVSLGQSYSSAGYLLTYVIVLLVFIQAGMLLYKWVKAAKEKEKLQLEMEFMNRNLELLINERTQELITRNQEIEKQNTRIALQNNKLSDTIHLKNKVFSVIAHDLRSPVVNILYMLNLLKEKEFKEKYDEYANSSIEYAQMVITLLENMLVWGRGQEDKIKYTPVKQDLADIILTNLSIFKETADKKDISVNFTQVGSSIAFIDKDLLDIIIRNLLSNAVKYTPRGGRISILLKDKTLNGKGILLKICDNGVGIPESKQKHLFTSAEVESSPGTENEKGTGLGLKLCTELVRINNGSISVESKEGEGTCFLITLPVV